MSKWLFEWPQVEFMSPGVYRLAVQCPIGVGYRIDGQQSVLASR
jgi:hypothetical protein